MKPVERTIFIMLMLLCGVFAAHLLFSAVAAFSARNYLMEDYGVYTNTLYNLARGDGFKFLVDRSYLRTHLSFSLVLLAPLTWIIRSPLMLVAVQWLFLISGCAIIYRTMRKLGAHPLQSAGVLLFFTSCHMTQSVMLSEFHGVSAYYLLLPWLFHELLFRKKLAILPLVCILGLREDAGLVVLPMLVFAALRDRWKTGYVLTGVSLAYVIAAVALLYPLINGVGILAVRAMEASPDSIGSSLNAESLRLRGAALLWIMLSAAPFFVMTGRKGWLVLLFPLTALSMAMLSGMPRQHALTFHYPAPIIAAMACGMAGSLEQAGRRMEAKPCRAGLAALVLVVAVSHFLNGFFLGGRASHPVYSKVGPGMRPLLRLADKAPADGTLIAYRKIAPYFAMRRDVLSRRSYVEGRHTIDLTVCDIHELYSPELAWLRKAVAAGEFGVSAVEMPYLLFQRGAEGGADLIEGHFMSPSMMLSQGGSVVYDKECGLSRYWHGLAREAPITLVYAKSVLLTAGRYEAAFKVKTRSKTPEPEKGFGTISVHPMNQDPAVASAPVRPATSFEEQSLSFTLERDTMVEPRVTGGGAELWINLIAVKPLPDQ